MISTILYSLYIAVLFALSIALHEFGHLAAFKIFANRIVRVRFSFKDGWTVGHRTDYFGLAKHQYFLIMITGISAGIIPLLFIGSPDAFWIALFIYLFAGARSDIINLIYVLTRRRY